MKHWQTTLLFSVLAGVCLYAVFVLFSDFASIKAAVLMVSPAQWLAIFGLSLLNYVIRFVRWERYIRVLHGTALPRWNHALCYVSGFALSTSPGKAGEAIRHIHLRRYGVALRHSIGALFVERLLDLLSIAVLSVVGIWQFPEYRWIVVSVIIGVLALVLALQRRHWLQWLIGVSSSAPRVEKLLGHVKVMLDDVSPLLTPRWMMIGLALGVISWGGEGFGFHLIVDGMGGDITAQTSVSIYAVAVLVGAISLLPGGLGGTEAVMTFMLLSTSMPHSTAIAATLMCRIATLWLAVALGLLAMLYLTLKTGFNPDQDNNDNKATS